MIRSWDIEGIISIKHAYTRRVEYAQELYEIALSLVEKKRWSWTAGVLLICYDYHSVVAWFIKIRGKMNCRAWLWWDGLWIREDEFHHSLNINVLLTTWMTP
ncbi:MAG: hypothetical protein AAB734_00760, partial [Patescibacteria group bacterium]